MRRAAGTLRREKVADVVIALAPAVFPVIGDREQEARGRAGTEAATGRGRG